MTGCVPRRTLAAISRVPTVEVQLPLLSTYLGHVDPHSTYVYLDAAPDLLALAAERLQRSLGQLP